MCRHRDFRCYIGTGSANEYGLGTQVQQRSRAAAAELLGGVLTQGATGSARACTLARSAPRHGSARARSWAARSARSAPGQDTRSGQGALARRHTDGPLRAALLKTTVTCEAWRQSLVLLPSCSKSCDLFASPRTNPDTDTGTGPIPPVTVFRVKAYSGGVLARAGTARGFTLSVDLSLAELRHPPLLQGA